MADEQTLRLSSRSPVPLQAVVLAGLIALCLGVAAAGSVFTADAVDTWYETIEKPAFTPPSWLFAPVWTTLYIAMAVAAWLVWRQHAVTDVTFPLAVFGVQLALNLAWSFLFFGLENPGAGLIEIVVLWIAIAATIFAFGRVQRVAAALLAPYLAWVSFAAALNFEIWRLN